MNLSMIRYVISLAAICASVLAIFVQDIKDQQPLVLGIQGTEEHHPLATSIQGNEVQQQLSRQDNKSLERDVVNPPDISEGIIPRTNKTAPDGRGRNPSDFVNLTNCGDGYCCYPGDICRWKMCISPTYYYRLFIMKLESRVPC
ncbi:uncharacterized protein [Halyomorpha halys]|uniref:uncharacterized protein isoform X1 n=1 Tax=Halyomorpha halys TaxID=286706 RepID=UPI0006D509E5|nr:uncharacterized protein LOC106679953 isoform X2 [Halyomorpha halys]